MARVIGGVLSTDCAGKKFLLTLEQLECVIYETIIYVLSEAMSLL